MHYAEFEVSNDHLNDITTLRDKLTKQGYLFFRGVLDTTNLQIIRREILQAADRYGIISADYPLEDGIFSGIDFPAAQKFETSHLYREILDIECFNAFGGNPVLMLLFSGLLEAEIKEHRRRIARITFPQMNNNTTPAHQDFFYIKGSEETYTCWIAAGDCPQELGGLAILEGSNHLGFINHTHISGTRSYGIEDELCDQTSLRWLSTNFQTGDLLLFHSFTIHKALHNITQDRLRISLEYRFQRSDAAMDPASGVYHMKGSFNEAKGD